MTTVITRDVGDRIQAALRSANGSVVTVGTLVDTVYADREDGGPDRALASVRSSIYALRRRGVTIETVVGYRVVSRSHAGLSRRQRQVVDAILATRGEGNAATVAQVAGISCYLLDYHLHAARCRGVVVERTCGYRLREASSFETRRAA